MGKAQRKPVLVSTIIGAGPAGLLFCVMARLLFEQRGGDVSSWPIMLFDKRQSYQRNHRLRLSPRLYRSLQQSLGDPRFDDLLGFLDTCQFSPTVNALEQRLSVLAGELGVHKELLSIGSGQADLPLAQLRSHLELSGRLAPDVRLTIVGADSVSSSVRGSLPDNGRSVEKTHQIVARLKLVGVDLPDRIGRVEQYKLSKLLGSVLDYRLNPNGFAEVDLFLAPTEHARLEELGSNPADPVPLTPERMQAIRSPILSRLVDFLHDGLSGGSNQVLLQSTFRLQHRYVERIVHDFPDADTQVFLLGDAAVSLPFFRGMACHTQMAYALARAHCDLVYISSQPSEDLPTDDLMARMRSERSSLSTRLLPGTIVRTAMTVHDGRPAAVVVNGFGLYSVHVFVKEHHGAWVGTYHLPTARLGRAMAAFQFQLSPAKRYERQATNIRRSEVAVVNARAHLIRAAREFVRLSSLLPFPLQTWFLSIPDKHVAPTRWTAGVSINALFAVLAAAGALLVPTVVGGAAANLVWWLAIGVQVAGGASYRAAQQFEPWPDTHVRTVWRSQIAFAFCAGLAIAATQSLMQRQLVGLLAATSWLALSVALVAGIYLFEVVSGRWLNRARLDQDDEPVARLPAP